ncbi:molybdopterin-dependent oxidoreductase [Eubacteriales bacterium OttesenSCG-928-A19]|nr:molybdopterin-dependent oxidoreductase [Eubacteriales bacterium OttesenSCG-928-A19]
MRHIGVESKRLIAENIVTGKAIYTADLREPHMKYGRVMRSPHAYAEILSIDASKALAMDGVYAVVTYEDVGESQYITNGFTPPRHCKPLDKYVRYVGDAVALVVADTEALADEAIGQIDVQYRAMTPVLTIDEAIAPDAPQLYEMFPGNIAPAKNNLHFEIGDIEKGFAEADGVFEGTYSMESGQNPLPVEPPTVLTYWEGDHLFIKGSIAAIAYCQQNVQASLDIPYENITTEAPCVGGSFGSKLFSGNVHPVVYSALMSKKAGYPVMYTYSKEEHFACHQIRMTTRAHIKLGIKKDGMATAIEVNQLAEAGYCASTQEFMLSVGTVTLPFLCKTNNQKFDADVVMTNKCPSGSFRGYGYLEITALMFRVICDACEAFDIDLVDYVSKNCVDNGETFFNAGNPAHPWEVSGGPVWSKLFRDCAENWDWKSKFKGWGVPTWTSDDGRYARGVGMAVAGQNHVGGKPSNTNVEITGLGAVLVSTAMTEFGAGVRDVMRKIVAEELNCPLEMVRMSPTNTDANPPDFGSTGSRSTYAGGISALWAAQDLKKKLFAMAEEKLGIPADTLGLKDGALYVLDKPEELLPLAPRVLGKVDALVGTGHFEGTHNVTMYNAQFLDVTVDKEMGTFEINDLYIGADAGRVINPLGVKNQLDGFLAGIGLVTFEETIFDENDNRIVNPSMIDYKTATFNDVPQHEIYVRESFKEMGGDSYLPYGAFGVGEPTISPGGPAIRMAIYNACGIKLNKYPFLPGDILAALKEKEGK